MKRFLFTAASPVLHLPQFFRFPLPFSLPLLLCLLISTNPVPHLLQFFCLPLPLSLPLLLSLLILGLQIW